MTDLASPDFNALQQRRLVLEARREETKRAYDELHAQTLLHQARLSWQPEVRQVLEVLQHREHQRSVGAYEQLLSALLQDVLPDPRELVMDLHSHGGLPALNLFLRKGSVGQPTESILDGAGGSVANVLSAGLRAIAVIRSGRRRFLVLDEGDCWISPDLAPRFAEVIQQMAVELKVQVLMISHHPEHRFPMLKHRLRLEKQSDGLSAQWAPDSELPTWEPDQKGIRSITLEDFQSHRYTHFPMAPGVTMLCGENNLGKSSVVTALRAVFLNQSNDTVIRHHQKSAQVTVDFGPEHVLRWQRHAKGKVKETYRHFSAALGADQAIHASDGAKTSPDWLEPTFGIGLIDDLDVQIRHQKKPIFLLDQPSTVQAKALAIGQDAGHVQAMMAIDKRECLDARNALKQGEKTLERQSRTLVALGPLVGQRPQWERLTSEHRAHEQRQQALTGLRALAQRWGLAVTRHERLAPLQAAALAPPPALRSVPAHAVLAQRWRRQLRAVQATTALVGAPAPPPMPALLAPQAHGLARRWSRALQTVRAAAGLAQTQLGEPPEPRSVPGTRTLARRWALGHRRRQTLEALVQHDAPQWPTLAGDRAMAVCRETWVHAQQVQRTVRQELEGLDGDRARLEALEITCPTCGQLWSGALG